MNIYMFSHITCTYIKEEGNSSFLTRKNGIILPIRELVGFNMQISWVKGLGPRLEVHTIKQSKLGAKRVEENHSQMAQMGGGVLVSNIYRVHSI